MAEEYDGLIVEESGQPPAPPAAPVVEEPPGVAEPATPDAPVDSAPTPPEKPDPVQQRINQAIARQRQAENEAAYWRGQAEAKTPLPQSPPPPAQPQGEPQEGDFETFPAYTAALHAYHAKQAIAAERATQAESDAQVAQQRMGAAQDAVIQAREAELVKEHPDYYDRWQALGPQLAPHVVWGLKQTGVHGPDLVLYLHDHPEVIGKLNQTPPHALGIELGMLRASSPGSTPARTAPPPTLKPEPPTPLPGGGHTMSPGFRDTEAAEQARFEAEWKRTSRRP